MTAAILRVDISRVETHGKERGRLVLERLFGLSGQGVPKGRPKYEAYGLSDSQIEGYRGLLLSCGVPKTAIEVVRR